VIYLEKKHAGLKQHESKYCRWWHNCHFWLNYSFNIKLYGEGTQSDVILLWMELWTHTHTQQNVLMIVTVLLCTWLRCNILRRHCIVDTCLVLLVGFWGTFRWNAESPHHISQWTPFWDRKRNEKKHDAIGIEVIGHNCSENIDNWTDLTFWLFL